MPNEKIDQILDPVIQKIEDRMDSFEQTLEQKVLSDLDQKIEKLKVPQTDAAAFFGGGTPDNPQDTFSIRSGESVLTSRGYSFMRAAAVAGKSNYIDHDNAKVEMAVSRQLHDYYTANGFTYGSNQNALLVPFGTSMIPDEFENAGGKGNDSLTRQDISAMMKQSVAGVDLEALKAIRQKIDGKMSQALSVFDDTALGVLTQIGLGEMIDLVRAAEVVSRIGAREIVLPPNGHLTLPKQTGAASAGWVGEAGTISTSEPQTGKLEMRAKKAAGLVKLPNELLRFATQDSEAFIRLDLAAVLARLLDAAFFSGTGSTVQPLGLLNLSGINTKIAGTVGANGDTLEPADLGGMLAEVEELDHSPDDRSWVWITRGKLWRNILNRRAAAVSSGDQEGGFLFAVNRDDIRSGVPAMLEGHPVVKSGTVPNDRVKGSSSDLTMIVGGIPDDVVVGRIGVLEFALATEGTVGGTNMFETDSSAIRAIEHVDLGWRNEDSWILIDTIDQDLPSGVI